MAAAMAINVATSNASRIVGPVLGGLLLARYGLAGIFWFGTALLLTRRYWQPVLRRLT